MNRFRIASLCFFLLLMGSVGLYAQSTAPEAPRRMVRNIMQSELAWPAEAEEALKASIAQLPGVEIVVLTAANRRIVVGYQPAENTTDQLAEAIAELGYPVKVLYYPPHEDPARQQPAEEQN